MRIPTRFICTGDIGRARALIGEGRALLYKLIHSLSYNKLPTASPPATELGQGITIRCVVNYGISEVYINVPLVQAPLAQARFVCSCLPHFALGVIAEVHSPEPYFGRYSYDITICNALESEYIEGVYDANLGKYYKGQYVLVTMAQGMSEWASPLDCQRGCLMDEPRFNYLMVSPLYFSDGMGV